MKMTVLNVKITILSTKNPIVSNKKQTSGISWNIWNQNWMFSYLFIICIVLRAYPRTATGAVLGLPAYMSPNIKSTWAVLGQSLGSHWSESSSLRAVFRQSWGSHWVVVSRLICQAVVWQTSGSRLAVVRQFFMIFIFSQI